MDSDKKVSVWIIDSTYANKKNACKQILTLQERFQNHLEVKHTHGDKFAIYAIDWLTAFLLEQFMSSFAPYLEPKMMLPGEI